MKKFFIVVLAFSTLIVGGCASKNDNTNLIEETKAAVGYAENSISSEANDMVAENNAASNDEDEKNIGQNSPEEEIANLLSDLGYDDSNKYSISYEDLNDDGIPEVFVAVLDEEYIYDYLYTYYDNSLINLAGTSGIAHDCFYNIEDTPYFGDCAYSSYFQYEDYYTIKDGQLVSVASINISNMPECLDEGFIPNYEATVGDNEVTVDEFWIYLYTILPSNIVDSTKRMMMDGIFEENEE